jgi:ABC-type transport system substrate-binding protein
LLVVAGCARQPAPQAITPEQLDPCRIAVDSAARLDTLTIPLLEPVNLANVNAPANDSERLLFRNYFDNLVRLDCQDVVNPALAESWSIDSTHKAWILTLRPGPGYPYGGRTFARQVADILNTPPQDSITANAVGVDSVSTVDDRTVRVALRHSIRDSAPRNLADPSVVVMTGYPFGSVHGTRSMDLG